MVVFGRDSSQGVVQFSQPVQTGSPSGLPILKTFGETAGVRVCHFALSLEVGPDIPPCVLDSRAPAPAMACSRQQPHHALRTESVSKGTRSSALAMMLCPRMRVPITASENSKWMFRSSSGWKSTTLLVYAPSPMGVAPLRDVGRKVGPCLSHSAAVCLWIKRERLRGLVLSKLLQASARARQVH